MEYQAQVELAAKTFADVATRLSTLVERIDESLSQMPYVSPYFFECNGMSLGVTRHDADRGPTVVCKVRRPATTGDHFEETYVPLHQCSVGVKTEAAASIGPLLAAYLEFIRQQTMATLKAIEVLDSLVYPVAAEQAGRVESGRSRDEA